MKKYVEKWVILYYSKKTGKTENSESRAVMSSFPQKGVMLWIMST